MLSFTGNNNIVGKTKSEKPEKNLPLLIDIRRASGEKNARSRIIAEKCLTLSVMFLHQNKLQRNEGSVDHYFGIL